MPLQTINNNESGLSVRTKLNTMLTELYSALNSAPIELWKVESDVLQPAVLNSVQIAVLSIITELQVANNFQVNEDGSVQILDLGGFEAGTKKGLSIDSTGKIVLSDPTGGAVPVQGTGMAVVTTATAVVDLITPTVIVTAANMNVDLSLPAAEWSKDAEVVVRKFSDDSYAVTINNTGFGVLNLHPGSGGSGNGCTTTEVGAWIRLKSDGANWYAVEFGGIWSVVV